MSSSPTKRGTVPACLIPWLLRITIALLLPIGVAVAASSVWFPITSQRVSVKNGRGLFQHHCQRCHAVDPNRQRGLGPSLANIGRDGAARIEGQSLEQYLWESIIEPDRFRAADGQMPRGYGALLNTGQLHDLVAYLATRGGTLRPQKILALKSVPTKAEQNNRLDVQLDTVLAGHALATGKFQCQNCHGWGEFIAGQDLIAPSLSGVGLMERQWLANAIRQPSRHIPDAYRQAKCVTEDGEVIAGRLLSRDDDSLRLLVRHPDGRWEVREPPIDQLLPVEGDEVVQYSDVSPMPGWTETEMTDQELERIVSFLLTLRE